MERTFEKQEEKNGENWNRKLEALFGADYNFLLSFLVIIRLRGTRKRNYWSNMLFLTKLLPSGTEQPTFLIFF